MVVPFKIRKFCCLLFHSLMIITDLIIDALELVIGSNFKKGLFVMKRKRNFVRNEQSVIWELPSCVIPMPVVRRDDYGVC